jgi:hypothetical protein
MAAQFVASRAVLSSTEFYIYIYIYINSENGAQVLSKINFIECPTCQATIVHVA